MDRKLVERSKGLLMAALDLSERVAARIVGQQSLLAPKQKRTATR